MAHLRHSTGSFVAGEEYRTHYFNKLMSWVTGTLDKSVAGDDVSGSILVRSTGNLTMSNGSHISFRSGSHIVLNPGAHITGSGASGSYGIDWFGLTQWQSEGSVTTHGIVISSSNHFQTGTTAPLTLVETRGVAPTFSINPTRTVQKVFGLARPNKPSTSNGFTWFHDTNMNKYLQGYYSSLNSPFLYYELKLPTSASFYSASVSIAIPSTATRPSTASTYPRIEVYRVDRTGSVQTLVTSSVPQAASDAIYRNTTFISATISPAHTVNNDDYRYICKLVGSVGVTEGAFHVTASSLTVLYNVSTMNPSRYD